MKPTMKMIRQLRLALIKADIELQYCDEKLGNDRRLTRHVVRQTMARALEDSDPDLPRPPKTTILCQGEPKNCRREGGCICLGKEHIA